MNGWKKITGPLPDNRKVLVTNNPKEMDAFGRMSHVWIGMIQESSHPDIYGRFIVYNECDRPVHDVTYYAEIPQFNSKAVSKKCSAEQKAIRERQARNA